LPSGLRARLEQPFAPREQQTNATTIAGTSTISELWLLPDLD
jgi:hypothetical protein